MSGDSFKKIRFYRRQWVINKDVQWAIMVYSIILGMVILMGSRILDTLDEETTVFFSDPLYSKILVYGIIFLFFITVILYGLYLTNRIVGPIYRLKIHMEDLAAGKKTEPLVFRKDDFFKEFAEIFNSVMEKKKN